MPCADNLAENGRELWMMVASEARSGWEYYLLLRKRLSGSDFHSTA